MSTPPDWWKTFFTGAALDLWRAAIPPEVTRAQADGLVAALALRAGERVLDVPCGNGRLALELAARGFQVCGVDLAVEFVEEARCAAAERGLEVELACADMRALPWRDELDAAFCMGNSFGYLEDRGNREFLAAVARSLRPGGRFVLEYPMVAEVALARGEPRNWYRFGDLIMLSEASYDAARSRLDTRYTFVDLSRGRAETRPASYQIYTVRELGELLCAAGFAELELLGGLDGQPFASGSTCLYVKARRSS